MADMLRKEYGKGMNVFENGMRIKCRRSLEDYFSGNSPNSQTRFTHLIIACLRAPHVDPHVDP